MIGLVAVRVEDLADEVIGTGSRTGDGLRNVFARQVTTLDEADFRRAEDDRLGLSLR
jgi:hypothetical protein